MGNPEGGYTTQPMMIPQQQEPKKSGGGVFAAIWSILGKIFNAIFFGFGATIGSKIANAIF
ncbi:DEKNAAC103474 [Brettanomyces naardenensis]|uniref:DEKNAAC103474 n=1 Tax=Brettanomyces naardenensis TaxID=13370 RepID=A0A448YN25_BRENA|nr:DEKNAAC103474 [Brettanomyces naardenensis]